MNRLHISLSGGLFAALTLLALAAPDGHAAGPAKPEAGQLAAPVTAEQAAFFESRIRPVFAAKCFSCHGNQDQRGGLRLDSREAAFKGSAKGAVIVSGEPEKSRLIAVIQYTGAVKMPPAAKLRPEEIAALTAWIKMGAPWPAVAPVNGGAKGQALDMTLTDAQRNFWSFRPVIKPALPAVKNSAWCQSPIDRFVLARLESKGLKPAPPADRRSLIRRVTFDLIGLPPTPEEVEAFVSDKSPNGWTKIVDRLLASPHYGERWGRHWLDIVRYADSNGLDEIVAFANAYHYRDYVVKAFNLDKPYNDFIREQLAGDLMLAASDEIRNDHITATGFLSLGPKLLAEPDKPKMVMDIVDEQIEVTSKAFLGLTVTCARCHNHKFDPIPTKDYYALAGIFKSTKTMASLNTVAMWQERPLQSKRSEAEAALFHAQIKMAQDNLDSAKAKANATLLASVQDNAAKYLQAGWELARQGEPISVADTPARPGDPPRIAIQAVKFNRGDIGRDTENFGKGIGIILNVGGSNQVEYDVPAPTAGVYQLEVRYASAEVRPVRLLLNGKLIRADAAAQNTGSFFPDGQRWEIVGRYPMQAGTNVLRLEAIGVPPHISQFLFSVVAARPGALPVRTAEQIASQYGLKVALVRHAARFAGEVRQAPSTLGADDLAAAVKRFAEKFSLPANPEPLYSDELKKPVARAQKLLTDLRERESKPETVMAVEDTKAQNCRVHIRGDTQNLGDEVPRHFLTVLGGDKIVVSDEKRSGRLELAEWIARPEHPLTSRVEMNRIWQGHFGSGIVQTPDNWGFLGLRPTNPELLDWLASTFVEQGWSVKKMHRLILTSNTYKMGVVADPKTEEIASKSDPDNTLLWKMPHRRLEAEPFRDALLFVAGRLDLTVGGTLLMTKNHDYVTNDQSGNAANYNAPRRGIYLPIIRNALYDMFQAFDYGDPSMVNTRRSTTTVAPQALFVMNSPFVIEQARSFSQNLRVAVPQSDADRIKAAYLRAYGRPPSPAEIKKALGYIAAYASRLPAANTDPAARSELAWASFCQLLLASNEFIYVN